MPVGIKSQKRKLTTTSLTIKRLTEKSIRLSSKMRDLFSIERSVRVKTGIPKRNYISALQKILINRKIIDKEVLDIIINEEHNQNSAFRIVSFYSKKLKTNDKDKIINHMRKKIKLLLTINQEINNYLIKKPKNYSTYFRYNFDVIFF